MFTPQNKSNINNTGFFSEDDLKFFREKWAIATQFPENKILTKQILARKTIENYIKSNIKKGKTDTQIPRQIEDFENILSILEKIQKCKNATIHSEYKIYLDYVFDSIINSKKNNYNSLYSIHTEEEIDEVIRIKERNRTIRKILSFGLA